MIDKDELEKFLNREIGIEIINSEKFIFGVLTKVGEYSITLKYITTPRETIISLDSIKSVRLLLPRDKKSDSHD
jgi:ferredoxin-fold anticodon binding domain-containing protein